MTDLEKYCVSALRLSQASANALLEEIQVKISIARANMIRLGIPPEKVEDDTDFLVCNVITKFVVSEMESIESERIRALGAYQICLDELRKSNGYAE